MKGAVRTFLAVQPLLEDHLGDAPDSVPDEVHDHYEKVSAYRKHYGTRNHVPNANVEHVKEYPMKQKL